MSHANTTRPDADALARQLYVEEKILRYAAGKADEYRELALRIELAGPAGLVRIVHGQIIRPDVQTCLATAEHFERRAAEQAHRVTMLRKRLNQKP